MPHYLNKGPKSHHCLKMRDFKLEHRIYAQIQMFRHKIGQVNTITHQIKNKLIKYTDSNS